MYIFDRGAERKSKREVSPMKTTDMKPREIAICKAAHVTYMANLKAGLVYDVVKLAWVKPEDLTIKPQS
jgi:hypothetical protein